MAQNNKLSKREAREARKIEKKEKEREKNIRFSASIYIPGREIPSSPIPDISKSPRIAVNDSAYKNQSFQWNIIHADLEGQWTWGENRQWEDDEFFEIENHFNSLTSNTWSEVESLTYNGAKGFRKLLNKYQDLDTLCNEAQDRWQENEILQLFTDQGLFRCRLGSYKRTWGIRHTDHYFLIWYERNHKICPVDD